MAGNRHSEKWSDVPADELYFVLEVFASHNKEMKIPPAKGLGKIFGTRLPKGWYGIGGSMQETAEGPLDRSTIVTVFDEVSKVRAAVQARLESQRDNPPQPNFDYTEKTVTDLWIGRRNQFTRRHSNPQKLWANGGDEGASKLTDADITIANIETFIAKYMTQDKITAEQDALEAAISGAIEPVKSVKPMKRLQIRKTALT